MIGNPSRRFRLPAAILVVSTTATLAGCMGTPTYGTGTPAGQQLVEDLSGILSPKGSSRDKPEIAYNPRPELVEPASMSVLPTPQDSVTSGENPAWPESPEQRVARIRAEATAHQDDPSYRAPVVASAGATNAAVPTLPGADAGVSLRHADSGVGQKPVAAQSEEFRARLASIRQGSSTTRRYLSEPPLTYRQPSATAPTGELGENEVIKERRARAAASGKRSWREWLPWD